MQVKIILTSKKSKETFSGYKRRFRIEDMDGNILYEDTRDICCRQKVLNAAHKYCSEMQYSVFGHEENYQ